MSGHRGARFVAVHGHFYQPPRENPWLGAVEVQDFAAPAHDWNGRITDECYAPNTAARRLSVDNRVIGIVNNFEKISFNVGPTLMAWLAQHRPDVAGRIVEADRASRQAWGYGNAIAQVFDRMIMPLASRRDRLTQVRWGIGDFRARFGREPEGIWASPRPPSTPRPWRSWPRRGSASPSSPPTRPRASGP